MKICVVGLGIMGGSVCLSLKRAGYKIAGYDISQNTLEYALNNAIIDSIAENFEIFDLTFICLPVNACINFINKVKFKNGSIVADICGVKKIIEDSVYKIPRNFKFVGTHPMAGREVSGIKNACAELFDGANIVITKCVNTDIYAVQLIKNIAKAMGFKRVVECSAEMHDKKIAYTSQLAHIVSSAYVKDGEILGCLGFTGGSFQDMTRIAGVDEITWTELYICNSKNLVQKLDMLIRSLTDYKRALEECDENNLKLLLKNGKEIFEDSKTFLNRSEISVTEL